MVREPNCVEGIQMNYKTGLIVGVALGALLISDVLRHGRGQGGA